MHLKVHAEPSQPRYLNASVDPPPEITLDLRLEYTDL